MLNRFHCPSVVIPLTELQWRVFLSEIPPSSVSFRKPFHPFPSPIIFHSAFRSWYTNVTRTELKHLKAAPDSSADRIGASRNTAPAPSNTAQFSQNVVSVNIHEFPRHSKENI
jgi:hypothetical protein